MPEKKVLVLSFDGDNSILNEVFLDAYWHDLRPRDIFRDYPEGTKNELKEVLRDADDDIIKHVVKTVKEESYQEVITMVGSNRQSYGIEFRNALVVDKRGVFRERGQFHLALEALTEIIDEEIKKDEEITTKPEVKLDPYLLADSYGKVEHGTSFQKSLDNFARDRKQVMDEKGKEARESRLNEVKDAIKENHPDWEFDDFKVTVLYAQMHKRASQRPNDEITFDFSDDETPLLETLNNVFKDFPKLIPNNVTLNLFHYDGGEVESKFTLKGEGEIDFLYEENIGKLHKILYPEDVKDRISYQQEHDGEKMPIDLAEIKDGLNRFSNKEPIELIRNKMLSKTIELGSIRDEISEMFEPKSPPSEKEAITSKAGKEDEIKEETNPLVKEIEKNIDTLDAKMNELKQTIEDVKSSKEEIEEDHKTFRNEHVNFSLKIKQVVYKLSTGLGEINEQLSDPKNEIEEKTKETLTKRIEDSDDKLTKIYEQRPRLGP